MRSYAAHLGGVGGVHHLVLQGAAEHRVVPDDSSRSQLLHCGSLLQQLGQVNTSSSLRRPVPFTPQLDSYYLYQGYQFHSKSILKVIDDKCIPIKS